MARLRRRMLDRLADGRSASGFALLYVCPFLAYGDRFAMGPILVTIARDLDEPLGRVAAMASVYFFLYGALQLVHGVLSDRVGRVRVMRWALIGMGVANVAAALSPNLVALIAAKAVTAGFTAALLPTSLVYVGDRVPFERRQHMIANVLAAGAAGTFLTTVGSGLLGRFATWRLVFLAPAVVALLAATVFGRLPESLPSGKSADPLTQVRRVLGHRWAVFLFLLALFEGAAMLTFLTFLPPALEAHGQSGAVAGVVVAAYGVAVFASMQLLKGVIRRSWAPAWALVAGGGAFLVVAYVIAALGQGVPNILVASLLIGLAFAFLHSTLQTWATEVAPEARGTATSLFVTSVFTGAALGTAAVSGLADDGRYRALFLVAAALTVPVAVVAAAARARYGTSAARLANAAEAGRSGS